MPIENALVYISPILLSGGFSFIVYLLSSTPSTPMLDSPQSRSILCISLAVVSAICLGAIPPLFAHKQIHLFGLSMMALTPFVAHQIQLYFLTSLPSPFSGAQHFTIWMVFTAVAFSIYITLLQQWCKTTVACIRKDYTDVVTCTWMSIPLSIFCIVTAGFLRGTIRTICLTRDISTTLSSYIWGAVDCAESKLVAAVVWLSLSRRNPHRVNSQDDEASFAPPPPYLKFDPLLPPIGGDEAESSRA